MRVSFFCGETGWDFGFGNNRPFYNNWFAIWWCRRCDCGIAIGRKAWSLRLYKPNPWGDA